MRYAVAARFSGRIVTIYPTEAMALADLEIMKPDERKWFRVVPISPLNRKAVSA